MWDRISNYRSGRQFVPIPQVDSDQQFAPITQVDLRETHEAYIFKANVPGLKKEEVRVQVLEEKSYEKKLEISGEWKKEEVQKGDTWLQTERPIGNFSRQFDLSYNSNVDKLHAQVQDDVLTVEIPKTYSTKPKVRQFEIV